MKRENSYIKEMFNYIHQIPTQLFAKYVIQ